MGNGQRLMWKDMTKPVLLEDHAGVPKPIQRPDQPQDVSESVTVQAERPAYLERADIVDRRLQNVSHQAKRMEGNKNYQFKDPNPNVGGRLRGGFMHGWLAPKCNILVGDIFASAGIDVRDPRNQDTYLTTDTWGNRSANIPGFQVLGAKDALKPGDVIAAGGHLGIYVPGPNGERWTISAASPDHGDSVVHNDWGFRGNEENLVRWRYVGPSGKARPPKWPVPAPPVYDARVGIP
jgi:hypothetical protein